MLYGLFLGRVEAPKLFSKALVVLTGRLGSTNVAALHQQNCILADKSTPQDVKASQSVPPALSR
ncbi:MAG: hypothetical protein AAFO02_22340, partial [Bacteroidota bacterium]